MALIRAREIDRVLRKGGRLLGNVFFANNHHLVLSPLEKQYLAAILPLNKTRGIVSRLAKWDEAKHARDKRGRFAPKNAEAVQDSSTLDISPAKLDQQPATFHVADEDTDDPVVRALVSDEGSNYYKEPEDHVDLEQKMSDGEATVDDYIDAIRNTLQHWEALHTNPDAYMADGASGAYEDGDNPEIIRAMLADDSERERRIGGNITFYPYAGLDIQDEIAQVWAENNIGDYTYYPEANRFVNRFDDAEAELADILEQKNDELREEWESMDEDERPDEPKQIESDDLETGEPDMERFKEWAIEYGMLEDPATYANYFSDDDIHRLNVKIFEAYRRNLRDVLPEIDDKIREVHAQIQSIDNAEDGIEKLQAATWAAHQEHATTQFGGKTIIGQYGSNQGISDDLFNRVQEEGLVAVFGQEAVDEFLGMPSSVHKSKLPAAVRSAMRA